MQQGDASGAARPDPAGARRLFAGVAVAAAAIAVGILVFRQVDEFDAWAFFGRWTRTWFYLAGIFVWISAAALALAISRTAFFTFVFAHVLLGGALVLAEAAGLLGIVDYRKTFGFDPPSALGYDAIPHLDESGETVGYIAHAWDLPKTPYPFRFKTDRRGYRNDLDRAAADVICLGDSFVVSGLVAFEDTFTARLEAGLGRPVVNVALIGTGPDQHRDMLNGSGLPLEGRLVIHFLFEGNDVADTQRYHRERKGGEPVPLPLTARLLTTNGLRALQKASLPSLATKRTGLFGSERHWFLETTEIRPDQEAAAAQLLDTLETLRDEVEAAGGSYAVAMFPVKLRAMGDFIEWPPESELRDRGPFLGDLHERVAARMAAAGIPFLDLNDALEAASRRGESTFFPDDTHVNAPGNGRVAEALLGWDAVRDWTRLHPVEARE